MILRRKCPHCNEKCISVVQVLWLLLRQGEQCCGICNKSLKISKKEIFNPRFFWAIEFVMYLSLISISFSYRSWMVFSLGLCVTASIEIIMLLNLPLDFHGEKNRIDKIL